jgi:hypothetical protein
MRKISLFVIAAALILAGTGGFAPRPLLPPFLN